VRDPCPLSPLILFILSHLSLILYFNSIYMNLRVDFGVPGFRGLIRGFRQVSLALWVPSLRRVYMYFWDDIFCISKIVVFVLWTVYLYQ